MTARPEEPRATDAPDPLAGTLAPPAPPAALADTLTDAPAAPADAPPTIGRYRVTGRLGAGAMGVVYAAHDEALDRDVAIKLLHREVEARRSDRLLREAQAMAKLSHPNVAQVHEAGTHEGQVFIVMELIRGTTLRRWLAGGPRPLPAIVERFVAAGRGLQAAHAVGLVHRDFKPDNVLVGDDGRVVVVDFGVAYLRRPLALPRRAGAGSSSVPVDDSADGAIVGTPIYMSPEQWLGGHVDASSDIFSFCAALYEAVHGERAFAGDNVVDLARNVLSGTLAPRRRGGRKVPRWLDRLLRRGLAVHPARRPPAMAALLEALGRAPQRRRRRWLAALGGLAFAGGLGLGASAWLQRDPCASAGERVHRVWNPTRRAGAEAALLAGGARHAADTWARIGERLDVYARDLEAGARDACEATRVRGEASEELLDLRGACLGTRLRALEAVLLALERESEGVLEHAIETLAGLPTIALCADPAYVRSRVPLPPTPALGDAVERLRDRLAELRAAIDAGDPGGLDELAARTREAESLDYPPVLAEALALQGGTLLRRGSVDAKALLVRAYQVASASGHDEVAFDVAMTLVRAASEETARVWLVVAEPLLARIEAGEFTRASFEATRLLTVCRRGDCTDAMEPLLAAIARHRERVGPAHPSMIALESDLANIYTLRGDKAKAEEAHRETLALKEQLLGPRHPRLVINLGNLARLALNRGDLTAAEGYIRRVAELLQGAPLTNEVLGLRKLQADLAIERGDLEAAAGHLARALADGGHLAQFRHLAIDRTAVLHLLGRREEALAAIERFTFDETIPASLRMDADQMAAQLAAELGRPGHARVRLERARLAALEAAVTAREGRFTFIEGLILAAEGEPRAAAAKLAALPLADEAPELAADVRFALARLLVDTEPARAHAYASAALADYDLAGPLQRHIRAELVAWQAAHPAPTRASRRAQGTSSR